MTNSTINSIWQEVRGWANKNAEQYLYVPIPRSRTDTLYDDTPLKPYRSYLRLWLSEMYLTKRYRWFKEWYPAVHASVKLNYGDQGSVSFDKVASLPEELEAKGVVLNYKLSELMPYNGGTVEIVAGLLALPAKENNSIGAAIKVCGEFAALVAPPMGQAMAVSQKVASGIKELMSASGGNVYLSMHQTFAGEGGGGAHVLKPGYIAVILATADQLNADRLSVKLDRLHYSATEEAEPKPLQDYDYMLFRIEGRDERDDWRLRNIQEPIEKAIQAVLKGNQDEANAYTLTALATVYQSSDLAVHDRRRVVQAIKDELGQLLLEGRGLQGDEETDLNNIMATRAMPVRQAMRLPQISLDETLEMPGTHSEDSSHKISIGHSSKLIGDLNLSRELLEALDPASGIDVQPKASSSRSTSYRSINAWIAEREDEPTKPLVLDEEYTLNFSVGQKKAASLIKTAAANISETDIPEEGLDTSWVVSSGTVELGAASDPSMVITQHDGAWTAQFTLFIPKSEESAIRQLRLIPRAIEHAELQILIFVRGALYRQFKVALNVKTLGDAPPEVEVKAAQIEAEVIHAPGAQSGPAPPHEWQTPPGRLTIAVSGQGKAIVMGRTPKGEVLTPEDWNGTPAAIAGAIRNVRDSAERFRAAFSKQLNDIDGTDMRRRLEALSQEPGKVWSDNLADAAHQQSWEQEIAPSPELYELAVYGYTLYQTLFPDGSKLRGWLDSLTTGWRIDISWSEKTDAAWVPSFPWGLLYVTPPVPDQPIDPTNFWGLRFRINYAAYAIAEPKPPALGSPDQIYSAYGLYWGRERGDQEIADEAGWQYTEWSDSPNQMFVPDLKINIPAKQQLTALFHDPGQKPTPVLYLFCQCDVGDGNKPVLRFAGTKQPADNLKQSDLGVARFKDQPLVFINACTSAGSDPYIANELEQLFFRRGCRAYLGTEIKVPVRLASRFAAIFYRFFYREVDPAPMAAGEAVYQARRFLWRDFRNVGGLFYAYINQYELYVASDAEVEALTR